jgi:hypothetical protein
LPASWSSARRLMRKSFSVAISCAAGVEAGLCLQLCRWWCHLEVRLAEASCSLTASFLGLDEGHALSCAASIKDAW